VEATSSEAIPDDAASERSLGPLRDGDSTETSAPNEPYPLGALGVFVVNPHNRPFKVPQAHSRLLKAGQAYSRVFGKEYIL
jgi:hypothetical protein